MAAAQAALFSQVCRVYAPDLPAAHDRGARLGPDHAWPTSRPHTTASGRLRRLPGQLQPRPGRGLHRPLAGRDAPRRPAPLRGRSEAGRAEAARLGAADGRQRDGGRRTADGRRLRQHPGLRVRRARPAASSPTRASRRRHRRTRRSGASAGALAMLPHPQTGTQQILCVNPAAPGEPGALIPVLPDREIVRLAGGPKPAPTTAFVSYPNALTAQCRTSGDATWLQVTRAASARATPTLSGSEGPAWGLHDLDMSLALGNLVDSSGPRPPPSCGSWRPNRTRHPTHPPRVRRGRHWARRGATSLVRATRRLDPRANAGGRARPAGRHRDGSPVPAGGSDPPGRRARRHPPRRRGRRTGPSRTPPTSRACG